MTVRFHYPHSGRGGVYILAAPLCYHHRLDMTANAHPQDPDPYTDRRAYPRVEVALPAFLQADGKRHSVQLLDLSAGGAKLNCSVRLAVGMTVTLDCGTLGRSAVVRWQNSGLVGLCFESELDARDVTSLIDRSKALSSLMKTRE